MLKFLYPGFNNQMFTVQNLGKSDILRSQTYKVIKKRKLCHYDTFFFLICGIILIMWSYDDNMVGHMGT